MEDWGTCRGSVSAYGKVGVLSGRVRGVCWRRGADVGGLEVFVRRSGVWCRRVCRNSKGVWPEKRVVMKRKFIN